MFLPRNHQGVEMEKTYLDRRTLASAFKKEHRALIGLSGLMAHRTHGGTQHRFASEGTPHHPSERDLVA